MRKLASGLAAAAVAGLIGGQAFGQDVVVVKDAPVHKIDPGAGEAGPKPAAKPQAQAPARPSLAEPKAVPGTLNAQFAALNDFKVMSADAPPPPPPSARTAKAEPAKASPKPPEGPTVGFAPSLIDSAGAFAAYATKAGAIDGKFKDGVAIGKAVAAGSAYETRQFQEGMVAYAALVALQEPAFVQAVHDLGRDARDRDDLAAELLSDPRAVLQIDGAAAAADTVGGVLAQMGASLVKAGQGARKAAYDVQSQPWSSEAAPEPQKRLAETKAASAAKSAMNAEDTEALMESLVAMRKAGPALGGRSPAPTPAVVRGLALAALAVLGHAGEEEVEALEPLLSDASSEDCVKMAKLNLYQCLAVAGPHYEHAFCLGQHALMDTGQCVISAAGQSPIPEQTVAVAEPAKKRSVPVPVALSTPAGPERSLAYARPQSSPPAEAEPEVEAEEVLPAAASPHAGPPAEPSSAERALAALNDRLDRLEREAAAARENVRPQRYARADQDDYDRSTRSLDQDDQAYDPYYGRDQRQDYDPYRDPYYGRYLPPGYAYRFGR